MRFCAIGSTGRQVERRARQVRVRCDHDARAGRSRRRRRTASCTARSRTSRRAPEVRREMPRHRGHELLEPGRSAYSSSNMRLCRGFDLVLRLAGAQRFAEIVPVSEQARVEHLQHAADVARAVLSRKAAARRVAVAAARRRCRRGRGSPARRARRRNRRCRADAARARARARCRSATRAPSVVNTSSSTAVSSTFEDQNARPVSRILDGSGAADSDWHLEDAGFDAAGGFGRMNGAHGRALQRTGWVEETRETAGNWSHRNGPKTP